MIRIDCTDREQRERALITATAACRRGDIVLVPTESSYALATDAFSRRGVQAIRDAKGQGSHVPLPVMVPSVMTVSGIASHVSDDARALMTAFWPGALTLLLPPQSTLAWDVPSGVPIAVRMPLHPLLLGLLERTGPTAVTSANAVGMDAPGTVDEAIDQLGEACAVALDAGPLEPTSPSTIVDDTGESLVVRRLGAVSIEELRAVCPGIVVTDSA